MFARGSLARILIAVLLASPLKADTPASDTSIPSGLPPPPVSGTYIPDNSNDNTTSTDQSTLITESGITGAESVKKAWEAFLSTLDCFENTAVYSEVGAEYSELLLNMTQNVITEVPTIYALVGTYRAVYFRKGTMTYIRIEKTDTTLSNSDYSLMSYLFRDDVDINGCFHVAPDSCEFTGTGIDTYEKMCQIERKRAQTIKQGVVNLVSNTGLSALDVTEAIAQCMQDNLTIHTVSIDCTMRGLKTDSTEIIIMLDQEAARLRQTYSTVEVDYNNLTVNYS